jgi:hypothetical protein
MALHRRRGVQRSASPSAIQSKFRIKYRTFLLKWTTAAWNLIFKILDPTSRSLPWTANLHTIDLKLKMLSYKYTDLDTATNDIRLLTLLPGEFDADIEIHIHHGPLVSILSEYQDTRMSLKELTETLPTGWNVFETMGGKYIFENDETEDTSWTHPDPEFARILYDVDLNSTRTRCILDYEALSYTWGDPKPAQTAFVVPGDGYGERLPGTSLILDIGSNLACALRHFRNTSSSRILWIDAICINQSNITERNEQVLRMKDIYKYAALVLVWLGEGSEDSRIALETIELFSKQVEYSTNRAFLRFPKAEHPDWFKIKKAVPFAHSQWRAIDHLLCRSWFDRVWTMQEIAVGSIQSIIQCGHATLEWDSFRRAVRCLNGKKVLNEINNKRLQLIALSTLMGSESTAVGTVIRAASHRKATDPRDKVYGILGILPPKFASLIKVDYLLPLELVYRNFALAYLDHFRRLDLIVERPGVSESWVMNWFHSASITQAAGNLFASGISSSQVQIIQPDMLAVTGAVNATIQSIEAPLVADKAEAFKATQSTPAWRGSQESQYIDGTPMEDALVSLWCLNYLKETFVVSQMGFPTLEVARRLISPFQHDVSSTAGEDMDFHLSQITSRVSGFCLFTTVEGYIGLCPP